jgi:hypothetical protein
MGRGLGCDRWLEDQSGCRSKTHGTTRNGSADSETVTEGGDKGLVCSVIDLACSHVLSVRRLHSIASERLLAEDFPVVVTDGASSLILPQRLYRL